MTRFIFAELLHRGVERRCWETRVSGGFRSAAAETQSARSPWIITTKLCRFRGNAAGRNHSCWWLRGEMCIIKKSTNPSAAVSKWFEYIWLLIEKINTSSQKNNSICLIFCIQGKRCRIFASTRRLILLNDTLNLKNEISSALIR